MVPERVSYFRRDHLTLEELRQRHRNGILALAAAHGARNVRVFGSIARGEQQQGSDVDLLVDFEPGRSLLALTGLTLDLERALNCKVDVVSSRGLRPQVAAAVLRDAVSI